MMQTTIDARHSLLLVVDVQARLAPAIDEGAAAVENNRRLLQAAQPLQVPVLVTEHYPQGLGATVEPLQAPMAAAGANHSQQNHSMASAKPRTIASTSLAITCWTAAGRRSVMMVIATVCP